MTTAIVLAAGAGSRMGGDVPKAFRLLSGKPLVCYSLSTLEACSSIDSVVLVAPATHMDTARGFTQTHKKLHAVIAGGMRRQDSVLCSLEACPDGTEWVAIHDAARPFAWVDLFTQVIDAAKLHGGAIAAARVEDTLKRCDGDRIVETVPRAQIWRAQTPQVFKREALVHALRECSRLGVHVTDDAEAMERAGVQVHIVDVRTVNMKLTTQSDWRLAEYILGTRGHA
jgi:2-C-methyl-D-erythritol 4-phosphate cytidylyltransferase